MVSRGSILTGVYNNDHNHGYYSHAGPDVVMTSPADEQLTPPDDFPIRSEALMAASTGGRSGVIGRGDVSAWLEIWDYAGGTSFRAFVSEDPGKSLFAFFDAGILGRDVKQAYVLKPSPTFPPTGHTIFTDNSPCF